MVSHYMDQVHRVADDVLELDRGRWKQFSLEKGCNTPRHQ